MEFPRKSWKNAPLTVSLALVAVGTIAVLLSSAIDNDDKKQNENQENDTKQNDEIKIQNDNQLHFNYEDENDAIDEKDENLPNYTEIGNEAKRYLKSMLSSQNQSSVNNNHYQNYNDDISKLLPISICSMNIEAKYLCIILSYLPIESLLIIQTIDNNFFALANHVLNDRKYLRSCARRGFCDRPAIWPWIASQSIDEYNSLYLNKLNQWRQIEADLHEMQQINTIRDLIKDIPRTLVNDRYCKLSKEQQRQLQTLLGVYSLSDPEVGYVQGMNFIAGAIIFAVNDELNAFGVFCQLMKRDRFSSNFQKTSVIDANNINPDEKHSNDYNYCAGGRLPKTQQCGYGLRDMFTQCLPACTIALIQFEYLFQKHLPILYQHMQYEKISIPSFTTEWFITLYTYILPLPIALRVYDLFLIDGWKILHRVGLAILSRSQNMLLTFTTEEMMMYLKQFPDSGIFISSNDEDEGDSFIEHAFSFKVTNYELHQYVIDLFNKSNS